MYTIDEAMAVVHARPGLVVALAFATYGFGFAQYITSMWMQRRNKDCPFFFWQHAWYFGHDLTFVLLFRQWFFEVDFWLFKVLWAGCVAFVAIEIYSLYLVVKNERQAVWGRFHDAPVTEGQAWLRGILIYAIGVVAFMSIRVLIGDPMCLVLMMSTNATLAIATQFKLEANKQYRPGDVALGVFIFLGTLFTFAPFGFFTTVIQVLSQPWFYILGVVAAVCSARYLVLAVRQSRTLPALTLDAAGQAVPAAAAA